MILFSEGSENRRLDELMLCRDQLPADFVIEYRARGDQVLCRTFRSVIVRPRNIDPDTFTFGMPGGFAHITVNDDGTYMVGVWTTRVGYHVQRMGRVIAYAEAIDAVHSAVRHLQDDMASEQRRRGM
jgi:hypothetical protein